MEEKGGEGGDDKKRHTMRGAAKAVSLAAKLSPKSQRKKEPVNPNIAQLKVRKLSLYYPCILFFGYFVDLLQIMSVLPSLNRVCDVVEGLKPTHSPLAGICSGGGNAVSTVPGGGGMGVKFVKVPYLQQLVIAMSPSLAVTGVPQ